MIPYIPHFVCEYCGESKSSVVNGEIGYFIPCQCKESKEKRDQDHYMKMELRKKAKRATR
jgi:hypothetical protein